MQPIALHPENPHYFLFRGKPAVLITATEHYGAVSNTAFDYDAYLDVMQSHGFNLTRLILTMRELESDFKGLVGWQNTLCPTAEHYAGPWARSAQPGCHDGGNKLDLDVWNEVFFDRLRDFCAKASDRGIVVEVAFFNQYYNNSADSPWELSPLNARNNVNGIGAAAYNRLNTCENAAVLAKQEQLVRRVVCDLVGFDNVYYEICNEPSYPEKDAPQPLPQDYPGVLGEQAISHWQNHLADVILAQEAQLGCRHMIAVCDPHESIDFDKFSVLNYHYRQWVEGGLADHRQYHKAQAFDETLTGIVSWNREMDFEGRRQEAWEFMMRGIATYDYLDFTFATDDATGAGLAQFPGGKWFDGTMLRVYLQHLKAFMDGLDFIHMSPDSTFIVQDIEPARAWALAQPGQAYAVYIKGSALKYLTVDLPAGLWHARWYNPLTGAVDKVQQGIAGGVVRLELPGYHSDIALQLTRTEPDVRWS